MLIYLSYYFIVGLCALLKPKVSSRRRELFVFALLAVALCLILCLRSPRMGADLGYGETDGYLGRFQFISSSDWNTLFKGDVYEINSYEKGYVVFNKLISYFGSSSQHLLLFVSVLSIFPIFYIFRKYSSSFELSIVIYLGLTCFLALFSALRQACAISICCFSYKYIKNKKIFPFVLTVLLAFTFHSSALFFLLVYPLYNLKIKRKFRLFTLLLIIAFYIFRVPLFTLAIRLVGREYYPTDTGAIGFFILLIAIYIVLIAFSKDNKETNGLMNIFLLLILCQCFASVHPYIARIGFYFMPFLCLLIPNATEPMDINTKTIIRTVFCLFFLFYGFFAIYSSGSSWPQAYPWSPFWSVK